MSISCSFLTVRDARDEKLKRGRLFSGSQLQQLWSVVGWHCCLWEMVKQSIVAEGCGHEEMLTLCQTRSRESWGSEEGLETMYSLQEYMTNDPSPPTRPHLPIPCSAMNSWMNQSAREISTLMLWSPLGCRLHQWGPKPIGQSFMRTLHMWTVTEFYPGLSCCPPEVSASVFALFPTFFPYRWCCRSTCMKFASPVCLTLLQN